MRKVALGFAFGLGCLGTAHAGTNYSFLFDYSDPTGNSAWGKLTATANGDGTYTAVSGFMDVTHGFDAPGTYSLIGNPNAPGFATSPSGYFYYDDQLLPSQNPSITVDGLLFGGTTPTSATEINLYSNGAGAAYTIYDNKGYTNGSNGSFSLAAVPGPAAVLPFALGLLRRRRIAFAS